MWRHQFLSLKPLHRFLHILVWVDRLSRRFKIADRGEIKHLLGFRINQDEDGVSVDQVMFVRNVLRKWEWRFVNQIVLQLRENLNLEKRREVVT